MRSRIPSFHARRMNTCVDSIDIKLKLYKNLSEASMLLELAIWKSMTTQLDGQINDSLLTNMTKKSCTDSISKMQCHTKFIATVMIIVPNVFSFLTDGEDGKCYNSDQNPEDEIFVEGCGVPEINGIFTRDGSCDGVGISENMLNTKERRRRFFSV
jgi:hypothetical protein